MLVEIKDYRGIGTGEYKYIPKENRDPLKKTIYDPDFISDEDIVRYGKEAMEEGIKNGQVDELIDQNKSMVSGTASNGLKFEGIKNLETGEIDNFWPVLEWSER